MCTSADQQISANSEMERPLADPSLDEYENFQRLDQALTRMEFSDPMKHELYALVAAVLHLGNVKFEENLQDMHGGCQVSVLSDYSVAMASKLIGVDSFKLRQALVSRAIQTMQSKSDDPKNTVIM